MSFHVNPRGRPFGIPYYAPSYRFVGSCTSLVPDVCYPWPVSMLKRIRAVDPGFVPATLKRVFRTNAGSDLVFLHHGVVRFDRSAQPDLRLDAAPHSSWGYLSTFPFSVRPNVVDLWFEGPVREGSVRQRAGLPPPFVPLGEWVEAMVREAAWNLEQRTRAERFSQIDRERDAEIQTELQSATAEAEYVDVQEAPLRRKLFDEITPLDVRDNEGRWRGVVRDPVPTVLDLNLPLSPQSDPSETSSSVSKESAA